jgi:hypothetical protein
LGSAAMVAPPIGFLSVMTSPRGAAA